MDPSAAAGVADGASLELSAQAAALAAAHAAPVVARRGAPTPSPTAQEHRARPAGGKASAAPSDGDDRHHTGALPSRRPSKPRSALKKEAVQGERTTVARHATDRDNAAAGKRERPKSGGGVPVKAELRSTEDILQLHCAASVEEVSVLDVHASGLTDCSAITPFSRAEIAFLHFNPLRTLDGLAGCRRLVKLDIAGCGLETLPTSAVWRCMPQLRLLYAHDNRVTSWEGVSALAVLSQLELLTLHGNPISRHFQYRHFVVNRLLSLLALDNYLVSDFERIQDAPAYLGRFAPMVDALRVPAPQYHPAATPVQHKAALTTELRALHTIWRCGSPVIMMQSVMRGFKSRRWVKRFTSRGPLSAVAVQKVARTFLWRKRIERQVAALLELSGHPELAHDRSQARFHAAATVIQRWWSTVKPDPDILGKAHRITGLLVRMRKRSKDVLKWTSAAGARGLLFHPKHTDLVVECVTLAWLDFIEAHSEPTRASAAPAGGGDAASADASAHPPAPPQIDAVASLRDASAGSSKPARRAVGGVQAGEQHGTPPRRVDDRRVRIPSESNPPVFFHAQTRPSFMLPPLGAGVEAHDITVGWGYCRKDAEPRVRAAVRARVTMTAAVALPPRGARTPRHDKRVTFRRLPSCARLLFPDQPGRRPASPSTRMPVTARDRRRGSAALAAARPYRSINFGLAMAGNPRLLRLRRRVARTPPQLRRLFQRYELEASEEAAHIAAVDAPHDDARLCLRYLRVPAAEVLSRAIMLVRYRLYRRSDTLDSVQDAGRLTLPQFGCVERDGGVIAVDATAQQCAAAVTIQSVVRAHLTMARMRPPLLRRVVERRAALCLQRWHRAWYFQWRMAMLTAIARHAATVDSRELYMEESVYNTLLEDAAGGAAFGAVGGPSQGASPGAERAVAAGEGRSLSPRPVSPRSVRGARIDSFRVTGLQPPPGVAIRRGEGDGLGTRAIASRGFRRPALAEHACVVRTSSGHTQLVQPRQLPPLWIGRRVGLPHWLGWGVEWVRWRDDDGDGSIARLLQERVQVSPARNALADPTAQSQAWFVQGGAGDTVVDVGIDPPNWGARGVPLVRLVFTSTEEAKTRAALLMALTWHPLTKCGAVMLPWSEVTKTWRNANLSQLGAGRPGSAGRSASTPGFSNAYDNGDVFDGDGSAARVLPSRWALTFAWTGWTRQLRGPPASPVRGAAVSLALAPSPTGSDTPRSTRVERPRDRPPPAVVPPVGGHGHHAGGPSSQETPQPPRRPHTEMVYALNDGVEELGMYPEPQPPRPKRSSARPPSVGRRAAVEAAAQAATDTELLRGVSGGRAVVRRGGRPLSAQGRATRDVDDTDPATTDAAQQRRPASAPRARDSEEPAGSRAATAPAGMTRLDMRRLWLAGEMRPSAMRAAESARLRERIHSGRLNSQAMSRARQTSREGDHEFRRKQAMADKLQMAEVMERNDEREDAEIAERRRRVREMRRRQQVKRQHVAVGISVGAACNMVTRHASAGRTAARKALSQAEAKERISALHQLHLTRRTHAEIRAQAAFDEKVRKVDGIRRSVHKGLVWQKRRQEEELAGVREAAARERQLRASRLSMQRDAALAGSVRKGSYPAVSPPTDPAVYDVEMLSARAQHDTEEADQRRHEREGFTVEATVGPVTSHTAAVPLAGSRGAPVVPVRVAGSR